MQAANVKGIVQEVFPPNKGGYVGFKIVGQDKPFSISAPNVKVDFKKSDFIEFSYTVENGYRRVPFASISLVQQGDGTVPETRESSRDRGGYKKQPYRDNSSDTERQKSIVRQNVLNRGVELVLALGREETPEDAARRAVRVADIMFAYAMGKDALDETPTVKPEPARKQAPKKEEAETEQFDDEVPF